MLKFGDVYHAPLDKMKAAADDWSHMTTKLEKLATDARTTMAARARDEYWRGVNAEVTKPFVDKTAKEFDDAAKAARGIKVILEEGHSAFKKAKDELKRIIDTEAKEQGLVVTAHGKVESSYPLEKDPTARHDPDYEVLLQQQNERIRALQRRIDAIVETCDDADVATANALKANITGDRHNFSAPTYKSLDAEEAQRALDLAKKGRDLSHEELARLNELLKDNHTSKEFSRTFYNGMGPKGSLEFFGQLATDTYDYAELDKQRLKDVQELQRNLGLNLAAATQGGDKWTETWSAEMRTLGTERIPLAKNDYNGPFGYQLLGGIMRYGNYDAKFLNPIAEHVVQLHQKDPYMFADNKAIGGWQKAPFNPSGVNGAGYDPVVPVLEALGHSPDAAKLFFSADPTAYNEDGTLKGGSPDLGSDKNGNKLTGYLDYFQNEGYKSFPDIDGHHPDDAKKSLAYLPDALGHALEAAVTGHGWDDPNPVLKRDDDTAEIMQEVINDYGSDTGLRGRHGELMDSLGRMGAAYIDDLNYSTYNFGGSAEVVERDKLFPGSSDGSYRTDFGEVASRNFMAAVASNEDAYKTLSGAQQVFEASGLKALGGDKDAAAEFAFNASKVHGVMDEARAIQIADDFKDDEDKKNLELEKQAEWRKYGVSSGVAGVVGIGSALVLGPAAGVVAVTAVPLVMEAVGGAVNTAYATETLQYLKDHEHKNDDQALSAIQEAKQAGQRGAVVPLINYIEETEMTTEERRRLIWQAEQSYLAGNQGAADAMKVK
ncbi:hypothetical protein AMK26_00420 [Streptomyces sp. CB03234]|uniref:hypothetical protein n=1 Tax=Streptomyces sp. (strain CB03234) TaxID=1703937 RepID=UPI00093F2313|nr:hypothetical protein [Streptomyces sp. CB03234]OKK07599.1 hypothetical protein AMK26_00420 [Streptomyces sp. CB03234]